MTSHGKLAHSNQHQPQYQSLAEATAGCSALPARLQVEVQRRPFASLSGTELVCPQYRHDYGEIMGKDSRQLCPNGAMDQ
jgi:hypothetical protein